MALVVFAPGSYRNQGPESIFLIRFALTVELCKECCYLLFLLSYGIGVIKMKYRKILEFYLETVRDEMYAAY